MQFQGHAANHRGLLWPKACSGLVGLTPKGLGSLLPSFGLVMAIEQDFFLKKDSNWVASAGKQKLCLIYINLALSLRLLKDEEIF